MARPVKTGLDYFPFDVDFFDDDKISAVSVEFGIKGEITAVKLLCAIYRQGYYIEWSESVRIKLLRQLPGVKRDLLNQIVQRLVRYGFFDEGLFHSSQVLSSRGIQRRYFAGVRRNRRKAVSEYPHLLIDLEFPHAETEFSHAETTQNEFPHAETEFPHAETEFPHAETEFPHAETEFPHAETTQKEASPLVPPERFSQTLSKVPPYSPPEEKSATTTTARTCTYTREGESGDGIDADIRALRGSQLWLEQIKLRYRVDDEQLDVLFGRFATECRCNGFERHTDLNDAKRHFNSWLRILTDKNEKTINGNGKNGKSGQRVSDAELVAGVAHIIGADGVGR